MIPADDLTGKSDKSKTTGPRYQTIQTDVFWIEYIKIDCHMRAKRLFTFQRIDNM